MKLLKVGRFFPQCERFLSHSSAFKVGKVVHGYEVKRVVNVPTFSMRAIELEHTKTGSCHLHLERDDNNNAFNVLLRTTPMNSTGVAHVLEHVALCGSKQFPVRDPFFKMLNRSMSSFMNAMTGADYTMYPFSTQHAEVANKTRSSKDFQNLMSVYLDAVFFPRIRKMDFMQEGWRLENEEVDNRGSPIIFKGVVFNEMKGLMADANYLYGTAIQNHLLPDHTYSVCSGGRPSDIPNLTWEDLQSFHQSHYHPSNAKFITYGNLPLEQHLQQINEHVMSKFDQIDPETSVPLQSRWSEPKRVTISCPPDALAPNPNQQTTVSVNYLLPEVSNAEEGMVASVLCTLLTDGPASPFYKSLIESGLGSDYSPNTGYHNHIREGIFSIGLQGISKDSAGDVENLIHKTIDDVIENGFSEERVESILHRIELKIKHQSSHFGLGLTFNMMPQWQHGADPMVMLQVDDLVAGLRQKISDDPDFLKKKCKEYFKLNNHRLFLVMSPDEDYNAKAEEIESRNLAGKTNKLSELDKEILFEQGKELRDNQHEAEDLSCLPTLQVEDIPLKQEAYEVAVGPHLLKDNPHVIVTSSQPTNGVTYFNNLVLMDELRENLKPLLPLFCDVLTQVGTKDVDYVKFSEREDLCTGGLGADVTTSCSHDRFTTETYIRLSSHCLDRNIPKMFGLWQELFHGVNLEDNNRLRTLIRQNAQDLANGVSYSGHVFAMRSASQYLSPSASYDEMFTGLRQVKLMQSLAEKEDLSEVKHKLREIADYVLRKHALTYAAECNGRSMVHATPAALNQAQEALQKFIEEKPDLNKDEALLGDLFSSGQADFVEAHKEVICRHVKWKRFEESILTEKQSFHELPSLHVNFISLAIPTPHAYTNEFAPTLRIAAKILSTKYLHREIREKGGAYGGGARHGSDGIFRFYSYRDPHSTSTLEHFRSSLQWMVVGNFTQQDIDEAKLAVFQAVDAPVSPFGRGLDFFLHGLTNEMLQQHRERLLAVTKDDLIHAAGSLLDNQAPCAAIIGPPNPDIHRSGSWLIDIW